MEYGKSTTETVKRIEPTVAAEVGSLAVSPVSLIKIDRGPIRESQAMSHFMSNRRGGVLLAPEDKWRRNLEALVANDD